MLGRPRSVQKEGPENGRVLGRKGWARFHRRWRRSGQPGVRTESDGLSPSGRVMGRRRGRAVWHDETQVCAKGQAWEAKGTSPKPLAKNVGRRRKWAAKGPDGNRRCLAVRTRIGTAEEAKGVA
jgi:hypothetical protein